MHRLYMRYFPLCRCNRPALIAPAHYLVRSLTREGRTSSMKRCTSDMLLRYVPSKPA
jgi:hypothetical protein